MNCDATINFVTELQFQFTKLFHSHTDWYRIPNCSKLVRNDFDHFQWNR